MKKIIALITLLLFVMPVFALADGTCHTVTLADYARLNMGGTCEEYPAYLRKGEPLIAPESVIDALLGEGWTAEPRGEYADNDEYVSAGGSEPWEVKRLQVYDDGRIRYMDPTITGEHGAERQAPAMDALPEASVKRVRDMLSGIIGREYLAETSGSSDANMLWDYSKKRYMSADEYADKYMNEDCHYIHFAHLAAGGLEISDEGVYARLGHDGLAELKINLHDFSASDETIAPMPIAEALERAGGEAECDEEAFYAALLYAKGSAKADEYRLAWFIETPQSKFIVDCATGDCVAIR